MWPACALAIHDDPCQAFTLTIKRNTVAVVSDGTAVLGLGDIGPEAAMPVMEGKAMLFKEFGGVDAFPLCLDTKDVDEIVAVVAAIAPAFGGINLEDIAAPRCFEVERRLRELLDIPVFHDDQHGTAIVVLAAFLNALRARRQARRRTCGSSSSASARPAWRAPTILLAAGVADLIGCDRRGALHPGRTGLDPVRASLRGAHEPRAARRGTVDDVLAGADVLIGLSGPGAVTAEAVRTMAPDAIVFAMANPTPEVPPEEIENDVAVIATGRSRLPQPDQQRPGLPGRLPRRAGRARARDQRGDEAGRGPGHRRRGRAGGAHPGVHRPERVQPRRRPGRGRGRGRGRARDRRGPAGGRVGRGPGRRDLRLAQSSRLGTDPGSASSRLASASCPATRA